MENKKQPEIRFPGFEDEWEERELKHLAEFNPKSNLPDEFEYIDLESVVGTELIAHRREKREFAPSRAQRLAQKNDVFYQMVRPYQKNNYLFDLPYDNYVFSTGYAQLRPKNNGYFLLSLVQDDGFVNRVLERCTGTSYPAINSNDLAKILVKVPIDNKEQQKIGNFFKQLDETIDLHQRELTSLQQTKKGFLQKMFPKEGAKVPEIRFPGFEDEWEEKKLGSITESFSGGTPTAGNSEYYGGEIPFIRSGEIAKNSTELFITTSGLNNSSAKIVEIGDILYALYGATSGEVSISKVNGAINQAILALRPIENDNPYLIVQWLKKQKETIIATYLQGGQGNLSASIVKKLVITLPKNKEEQQKIGNFFKQLDDTIALHQRELELLKETKKGFLQKLFV